MKVICINGDKKLGGDGKIKMADGLVEGDIYTVIKIIPAVYKERGFVLKEIKSTHPEGAFLESRFAPLSEIDEKELIKKRKLVNI